MRLQYILYFGFAMSPHLPLINMEWSSCKGVGGRALLGEQWHDIQVGDSILTGTDELHQFEVVGTEPLGFICAFTTRAETDSCVKPVLAAVEKSQRWRLWPFKFCKKGI
jgi:hypothetical protein